MRYITKCAKQRGSKVDHASKCMMSLAIDSTMQLTDQNWFTRSLSGGYKRTNGCRVLFKNGRRSNQIKCSLWPSHIQGSVEACLWTGTCSTKTHSQWARRGWWMAMANDSMRSIAMSDVFHISSTLLIGYLQKWSSFALPSRTCSNLSTCGIFRLTHSKF